MQHVTTASCRIQTPEGVSLSFSVASAGDRLVAFLLDMLLIAAVMTAIGLMSLPLFLIADGEPGAIVLAILNVAAFLLFNAYFIVSEMAGSGTTVGKRRMGLRVIARDGGPLTADMIVARNLTRDLEIYLPVIVFLAPETLLSEQATWGRAVGAVWLLILLLLPLFGRYRLRAGDLIAGTVVVSEPTSVLLPDLVAHASPAAEASAGPPAASYEFMPRHLDQYGIHELHVLEDIFRKHDEGQAPPELLAEICERIKKRIEWPREQWTVDPEPFLRSFYKAQRAHLERKLLFGKRKERKSEPS